MPTYNSLKNINAPAYNINFKHNEITYHRIQLFKNSIGAKYIGVLHEYLEPPPNVPIITLDGCYIQYGANGARSKDPKKYLNDAEVFEKVLEKEPNNPRNVFYCAQSYRDAGVYEKALEKYLHRVAIGGWEEECYVAAFNAAKITEALYPNDIVRIQSIYLKTHNILPIRSEALCYLAMYCRKKELYDLAYFYAKLASLIPKPDAGLFLATSCYDWKIYDEFSVATFYTGKMQEFKEKLNKLICNDKLHESEKSRILFNFKFI